MFKTSSGHFLIIKEPDRNPRSAHTQLYLYKRALSKRTGIPLNSIQTAAFNEDGYTEFGD